MEDSERIYFLMAPMHKMREGPRCPVTLKIQKALHAVFLWNLSMAKELSCKKHDHTPNVSLLLSQQDHFWIIWILFSFHHRRSYLGLVNLNLNPKTLYMVVSIVYSPAEHGVCNQALDASFPGDYRPDGATRWLIKLSICQQWEVHAKSVRVFYGQ
jgi:hypothetical protein